MINSVSKTTDKIELGLTAYHNCDDVQLFWRASVDGKKYEMIPGCLGFEIDRQRMKENGEWGPVETLRNRVGFSDKEGEEGDEKAYPSKPSSIWPFQRYDWTDHGANNGQTVRYRIKAMYLPDGKIVGDDKLQEIANSGWTEAIAVTAKSGNGISAFFNRGMVMSQYVSRIMRKNNWTPKDLKNHISDIEEPLRLFLSGELRIEMLKLIKEVYCKDLELYAALYELNDIELIDRLRLLGKHAHIVLANGSDRYGDGNEQARQALKSSGVDVRDRMLGRKGLGHNKFAVVVDKKKAVKAWTGSTNWSTTGLCTQLNDGILIEDSKTAQIFLDQWNRLADAKNNFPPELVRDNDDSPRKNGCTDVWFTRMHKVPKEKGLDRDLQALVDHVNGARQAILFVMFSPGDGPLNSILEKSSSIYVRGVVNTIREKGEKFSLHGDKGAREYKTAMVQPEGIENGFSAWLKEVTRSQFLYPNENPGIGHAITHAKIIVIDPLSGNCKVITGSHNFSKSASEKNDENFIVISGNRPLAEAYAVSCIATYSHYRWRAYLKEMAKTRKKPWSHLSDNPDWQVHYLSPERKNHLDLWCRQ